MNRAAAIFLLCVTASMAESDLSAPIVGVVRDIQGRLHPVHGVAGSFVLRRALAGKALDWAFDASGGLVRTAGELLVLDAEGNIKERRAVPTGQVVLSPRYAFLTETGDLWPAGTRNDRELTLQPVIAGDRVVAIGPAERGNIGLAVCRAELLRLLTVDGTDGALIRESAPGGTIGEEACRTARSGNLLLLHGRFLLASEHKIICRDAADRERRIALPASHGIEIHQAGEHSVQIQLSSGLSLLLRVRADGEELYELPAAETRP